MGKAKKNEIVPLGELENKFAEFNLYIHFSKYKYSMEYITKNMVSKSYVCILHKRRNLLLT